MKFLFQKGNSYAGKPSIEKECSVCKQKFVAYAYSLKNGNGKFCSRKCFGVSRKGISLTDEVKSKISIGHKGINTWMKGMKLSKQWKKNIAKASSLRKQTIETRRKIGDAHRGEKSYLWQGGKTALNRAIRNSFEYKLWREKVYQRDSFTCQLCRQRGGRLNADHIKPFSLYPELRFELSNGRTLCHDCHKKTETYGSKILNLHKSL